MDAEITIIGAGVVGLALSEKLSGRCNNLFLIEKHKTGQETSGRTGEIHQVYIILKGVLSQGYV